MKRINKVLTALSLGMIGAVLYTPTVSALDSKAKVEFTNPTNAPGIIDPDSPNNTPFDPQPEGEEVSGDVGVLTLDYVSNFDFGSYELSRNKQILPAENTGTPFAQVTDVRGTGAGWRLTAKLNGFAQGEGDNKTNSLQGSTITLSNSQLLTTDDNNIDNQQPTTFLENAVLTQGLDVNITTAEQNQGKGTWLTTWADNNTADYNQSVVLSVPAAVATAGQHTGTITWTLYNAPTGTDSEPVNQPTEPVIEP